MTHLHPHQQRTIPRQPWPCAYATSMRIGRVQIENFRSHVSTDIEFDDYTALIGANGAGKSSVFYALEWFFEGGPIASGDVAGLDHSISPEDALEPDSVTVRVTFVDLTTADKARLGEYGRGEKAHFARVWDVREGKSKVVGNALAGPGFPDVRREARVTFKRKGYAELRQSVPGLPELTGAPSAGEIDQALADWESSTEHSNQMVNIDHSDANHLFGINGRNVIRECVRFILIPAATDISANVGASGKGSTLAELIGAVTSAASAEARAAWATKYATEIAELNTTIREGVDQATLTHAARINTRLAKMIPEASVGFTAEIPDWSPRGEPSISTKVSLGNSSSDLGNQGHGTQRAVMIAMFQAMAPDHVTLAQEMPREDLEDEDDYQDRLAEAIEQLPTLIVCIEEPEIYQHPLRARAFARVLSELAEQPSVQVAVATHSPYFVRPVQFENLRRLSIENGISTVHSTTLAQASAAAGIDLQKFRLTVDRYLPSVFSEGFFADTVVLVEGDTDKVCIEGLADSLDFSFDLAGIAVIQVGGKPELRMSYAILTALKVPVYLVVDGDAKRADEKKQPGTEAHAKALESNRAQTSDILGWMPSASAISGDLPYSFGDPTVISDRYTVWHDDLESELDTWPSFMTELAKAGGALRQKKAFTYRAATLGANRADVPPNLVKMVEGIRDFSGFRS